MKLVRLVIALIVGAALAGGGYYYYREQRAAGGHELVLYGNVDIREADLAFNNAGRVEKMLVEEGDPVAAGQLLATLEPTRFEAEVESAKGNAGAQKAVLDRLLRGSRPEEIEKARQDVKALEAELENDHLTVQRLEKLALDRFAPQQELDDTRTRARATAANLEAARQVLSLAIQGPRQEDIDKARADLKAAEGELALARRRLEDTNLFAKNKGWVLTRILEPGEVVLANSPAYTIAISDPVWVRTYVSEPDLGRIYPNMKAEVFTDSAPTRPYQGWIGFISPVAEFTPKTVQTPELRTSLVYRIRVYVNNPGNKLRQGMPVTVKLLTELQNDVPRARAERRAAP